MSSDAIVFDIQKFSIHDGPGIRTIIFLKGCNLRCQWCANPESNHFQPELLYDADKCIGCGRCTKECENAAIESIDGSFVFNHLLCKDCLNCTAVCHSTARKASGKSMSVEQVLAEVEKDMVFYETSGGGITFSGGEPLLWPLFIMELGTAMKNRKINTALETCGDFPQNNIEVIKEVIDLILFDIKFVSEEKHIKFCGKSNKQIIANFKSLIQEVPVIVRIPIIPKINDTSADLNDLIKFLMPNKDQVKAVNLLPYHNLGVSKFDALCRPYLLESTAPPSKDHMEKIKKLFEEEGYSVKIGG